jgi:hypothetical protein
MHEVGTSLILINMTDPLQAGEALKTFVVDVDMHEPGFIPTLHVANEILPLYTSLFLYRHM